MASCSTGCPHCGKFGRESSDARGVWCYPGGRSPGPRSDVVSPHFSLADTCSRSLALTPSGVSPVRRFPRVLVFPCLLFHHQQSPPRVQPFPRRQVMPNASRYRSPTRRIHNVTLCRALGPFRYCALCRNASLCPATCLDEGTPIRSVSVTPRLESSHCHTQDVRCAQRAYVWNRLLSCRRNKSDHGSGARARLFSVSRVVATLGRWIEALW